PIWLTKNLPLDTIRKEVEVMELQAEQFYVKAAEHAEDVGVRRLLGDLAEEEKGHEKLAVKLTDQILSPGVRAEEDKTRRRVFAAGVGQRHHDRARRPRPHHALSGAGFVGQRVLDRDGNRGRRRVLRTMADRLHPRQIYGHAVPAGRVPDRAGWRDRARRR